LLFPQASLLGGPDKANRKWKYMLMANHSGIIEENYEYYNGVATKHVKRRRIK
jgi:hypothetical protein